MIITNLIGGLGNQMFQYAAGRALSLDLNEDLRFSVDQFSEYQSHNGFELADVFALPSMKVASSSELEQVLGWRSSRKVRRVMTRLPRLFKGKHWVDEANIQVFSNRHQAGRDFYLHGYWQAERFFIRHAAQIKHDFVFTHGISAADQKLLEQMRMKPSVSVHVRRGDYNSRRNQSIYAQTNVAYYRSAMAHIRERVTDAQFFVFSDDPVWVTEKLLPHLGPLTVVKHNVGKNAANDLRLMMNADHNVIANSTFSWWAAWLNDNPKRIVLAPKNWYVDDHRGVDIVPDDWIRL